MKDGLTVELVADARRIRDVREDGSGLSTMRFVACGEYPLRAIRSRASAPSLGEALVRCLAADPNHPADDTPGDTCATSLTHRGV